MKRFTKYFLLLAIAFVVKANMANAQVNVVASAGLPFFNYPTLNAAFAAINAGTHMGMIRIGVSANIVEPGPAVLNSNGAGPALYQSVIIAPIADGISISGNSGAGRGLIEINGGDSVMIEGDNPNTGGTNRNLTIQNTSTSTFSSTIRVAVNTTTVLSADNITFRNIIINGGYTGRNVAGATSTTGTENTTYGILVTSAASGPTTAPTAIASVAAVIAAGATVSNLIISNNTITNAARGIAAQGSATTVFPGLNINNNIIGNATIGAPDGVYSLGITVNGANNAIIRANTIYIEGWVATNANAQGRAIDFGGFSATGTAAVIENNIIGKVINNNTQTYPACGINLNGGTNHIVRNNMIYNVRNDQTAGTGGFGNAFGAYGIRIAGGTGHLIYFNSVHLTGVVAGSVSNNLITCLAITGTGITGCDVRNNIFSNQLTGGNLVGTNSRHTCVALPSGAGVGMNLTWNNNAYYQGGTVISTIAQVGFVNGTSVAYTAPNFIPGAIAPATNLRSYTSTLSVAGTNDNLSYASLAAPPFISATDLHLDVASVELVNVEQKGDATVPVLVDIDGNVRPNVTTILPDMGADEVVSTPCSSASGGTITPATYARCNGQTVLLTSTGATTGSGITYQWQVSAVSGGPYVNVSGGSGATSTSYTSGALATGVYYYVLQTTCSAGPVTGLSNEVTVTVNPVPTAVASSNSPVCAGSTIVLTGTTDIGTIFSWTGPNSFISGSQNNSIPLATAAASGVYSFAATANGCTSPVATTTVMVNSLPTGVVATVSNDTVCSGTAIDLSSSATPYATTLLTEDFNGLAPGWTTVNNSVLGTPANAAWTQRPNGYIYNAITYNSNDNSQFYFSNSDSQGSGSTASTILQSPAFSTVGYSTLNLSFYQYFRYNAAPDSAIVEVSTNGTTWTVAQTYTATTGGPAAFVNANVNLDAYVGNPTLSVRFRYYAPWGWYWAIDNVNVTGNSTAFTYNWTSNPAGFTSTQQNPTGVVPTATTIYTVAATNILGCSSTAVDTVTVSIPSVSYTASPNDTICVGDNVTLSGTGAVSYSWTGGITNGIPFAPGTSGTYDVTGTDAIGCTNTASAYIQVYTLPVVSVSGNTNLCPGGTNILTGSSGGTSQWYFNGAPIGGATSNTYGATAPGHYNMTKTNLNGCTDSAAVGLDLIAVPNPTVSYIALPNDSVCTGGSVTLSGTGATSYSWSGGITNALAFTPGGSLTYTVTGTDANGCTNTASAPIVVNVLPTVSYTATANDTICMGSNLTLSGTGASSYSWSGGISNAVAFAPGGSLTYTVTGTDLNGCTNTASAAIVVNTLPTVSYTVAANDTICPGGSVTLSGTGASSYSWTGGITNAASFNPGSSLTYTVTGTDANGCTNTALAPIVVGTNPTVSLGADVVQANPPALLDAGAGFTSYLWSTTATTQTINVNTNGQYIVTVTNIFGCSDSDTINVNFTNGIVNQDGSVTTMSLYPNPNNGPFNVSIVNLETTNLTIDVLDMIGQVVYTRYVGSVSGNLIEPFDLTELRMGSYILRMTANGKSTQMRFIVNR